MEGDKFVVHMSLADRRVAKRRLSATVRLAWNDAEDALLMRAAQFRRDAIHRTRSELSRVVSR